ncbi:unnamed protein product [Heterobilharzia americana]|nr:unnamed protein product [Heterobilharzia americana]
MTTGVTSLSLTLVNFSGSNIFKWYAANYRWTCLLRLLKKPGTLNVLPRMCQWFLNLSSGNKRLYNILPHNCHIQGEVYISAYQT